MIRMSSVFTKNIAPYVQAELTQALAARHKQKPMIEFSHLENAHVLGQESTYWHVKTHLLMLLWAVRNSAPREFLGSFFAFWGPRQKLR